MAIAHIHLRCSVVVWLPAALVLVGLAGWPAHGQAPSELNPPMLIAPGQAVQPPGLPGQVAPPQIGPEQIPPGPAVPAQAPDSKLAPGEEAVVEVQVKGQNRVSMSKILPQIHTRAGRAYDPDVVEEDVRRLNKTGLFFTAKPFTRQVPGGRIVIYEVVEKPIIDHVKYVGNTVSKKKLAQEALVKAGDAMDLFAIEESRRRIEEYYHTKGYPKARVTIVEGTQPSDKGVVFLINEGYRQRFLWTGFVGNTIADDARLRTQIKSKPGFLWFLGGDVDAKEIEEDKNRLTAYYRALGFFDAKVGREWESSADGKWVYMTYAIDEGTRYVVRNVSIIGNTKFATQQLQPELKLRQGDFFNQNKKQGDVNTIQDIYGAVGYVFADIQPELLFPEDRGQVDLVYRIKEGNRYRVGRVDVQIKGEYPHTRLATVLNRMSLKPGDIVDIRELRASERRLKASGLFLIDPSKGNVPKIVFSPPTAEDLEKGETSVARKPKRPDGYRGQSPDEPADQDALINLSIEGEFLDQPQKPTSPEMLPPPPAESQGALPAPMVVRGQSPNPSATPLRWLPWTATRPAPSTLAENTSLPGTLDSPAPPGTAPPSFAWPAMGTGSLPMVTRGQYTAGTSFPQFNANAGRVNSYVPRTSSTYPSTSTTPTTTTALQPTASSTVQSPAPQAPTQGYSQPGTISQQPAADQNLVPVNPPTPSTQPATTAPPYGNQVAGSSSSGQIFARPGSSDPLQPPILQDQTNLLGLPPDEQPLWLPLRPETQETETGKLMFSVGVNSDAGLIGSVVIDEQNFDWTRWPRSWEDVRNATAFRGAGQRFRAEAVPGTLTQRYSVTFQEPYLLDTNVSLGLSAYYFQRDYVEWDEERLGGRVSLGYQFTPDLSGVVAVRAANVNISNPQDPALPDLQQVLGNNALYGFETRLIHDTRDSTFLPTEGHLLELAFEQVVGSFQYPRGEIDFRQYFMLHERPDGSGRHVLSLGGRVALTGDNTPIYERYYAGGFSTIRGFEFRDASPVRQGVYVGGDLMVLASAEYMFPITASDALRGVVFVDTGAVQPTIHEWTDRFRVAPGAGLRITIPAMGPAPIALDLAFPVSRERTDHLQAFSFFVGFTR